MWFGEFSASSSWALATQDKDVLGGNGPVLRSSRLETPWNPSWMMGPSSNQHCPVQLSNLAGRMAHTVMSVGISTRGLDELKGGQ